MSERVAEATGRDEPGRGLWIGLVLGTPLVAYGTFELIRQTGWSRSFAVARWLGGGLLLHDLVLVPTTLAVVWLIGRWAPRPLRTPLRAGVLATALVIAVAWPGLRGYGNRADNPTIHPLDYGTAVLTLLVLVWAVVGVWAAWSCAKRVHRLRASGPTAGDPGSPRTSRTPAAG
jgi:hypothetical protein